MKNELDKALVEKYPRIFRNRFGDMRTTAMCWGFEHGDGWYNIIDVLCMNIEHHIRWLRKERAKALLLNRKLKKAFELNSIEPIKNLYKGSWWIEACNEYLKKKEFVKVPEKVYPVIAVQVKEKFGTLRFYYAGGDEVVRGMVSMAESMSAVTCEVCGNAGSTRGSGWLTTLCDEHADGREEVSYDDE